jgi:hypothetical protein
VSFGIRQQQPGGQGLHRAATVDAYVERLYRDRKSQRSASAIVHERRTPTFDPSIGDIAYYAPWGNLAIFHKDFGYSSALVKLGTIDSGLDRFNAPGSLKVTIELVK